MSVAAQFTSRRVYETPSALRVWAKCECSRWSSIGRVCGSSPAAVVMYSRGDDDGERVPNTASSELLIL